MLTNIEKIRDGKKKTNIAYHPNNEPMGEKNFTISWP